MTNGAGKPDRRPVRILIANDQEWTARSVETILAAEGYEVHRAYTGRQAIERALEILPDLAILDSQMPDLSGMEVCRVLRQDSRIGSVTPILLITAGPAGRAQRLEALQAGAWEFYGQPLDAELLLLKVKLYLEVKAAADAYRSDGLRDEVTGLYNRRGLVQRTDELLAEARRHPRDLASVTVTLEHPALATMLEEASSLALMAGVALRGVVRAADIVGRLSDLRFAVVGPTAREGAQHLADRLVEALAGLGNSRAKVAVRADVREVRQADLPQADFHALLDGVPSAPAPLTPTRSA